MPGEKQPASHDAATEIKRGPSLLRSFFASSLGTLISRILGAARDLTISHLFGATKFTDIFFIAFTIPNIFRRFVADEGLTGAMIPALSQEEARGGRTAAQQFSHATFTLLLAVNIILCIVGIVFAPSIVLVFGYGFKGNPVEFDLAVRLTRWLFPFLAFVSIVSFFEGVLNFRGHFFLPKLAPGVVSASIIGCAFLLYDVVAEPVFALVIGVLIGGVLHLLIVLPPVWRLWVLPRVLVLRNNPQFQLFLREMLKVVAIGVFAQLNIIVLRSLASMLPVGSVTWFWNANRMIDLFQGIIAIGIGSALLPSLSRALADQNWKQAEHDCLYSLRLAAFLLLPLGAGLLVSAVPTTSMLFRHGHYTYPDVVVTAMVLSSLIPFMWAVAAINIIKKIYFALNLRTPLLVIGAIGTLMTVTFGILFMMRWGIVGLGMALSTTTLIQLVITITWLCKKLQGLISFASLIPSCRRILLAIIPQVLIMYGIQSAAEWSDGPGLRTIFVYTLSWSAAAIAYAAIGLALKFREFQVFGDFLVSRFLRRRPAHR